MDVRSLHSMGLLCFYDPNGASYITDTTLYLHKDHAIVMINEYLKLGFSVPPIVIQELESTAASELDGLRIITVLPQENFDFMLQSENVCCLCGGGDGFRKECVECGCVFHLTGCCNHSSDSNRYPTMPLDIMVASAYWICHECDA